MDDFLDLPVVQTDGVLRVPLLTDLPALSVPGAVLFVDQTSSLYLFDGTSWSVIGSGGGGGAVNSVNGQTGVVVLAATDIGLGNVDNTSDLNKPVSTATQAAIDLNWTALATTWDVAPTLNKAITGGEVYDYTINSVTRYRFVPTTYDASQDAFYASFNNITDTLTTLVAQRGF